MLWSLVKRNCKIYFKDKGVFFPSLITPFILLLLYLTFLRNVYVDTFNMTIPAEVVVEESLINGFVGGWLISSLLAVCCITVSFCANTVMVSDKSLGAYNDLLVTSVKRSTLNISYYLSTVIVSAVICLVALVGGFIYLLCVGWYLSFVDVLLLILDCILLIMFGTALSSLIFKHFANLGGASAICSIVSSAYGFICGAYMPISQFGPVLQKILMFFPWTYGTGLVRSHLMRGVLNNLSNSALGSEVVNEISKGFDINLSFFGHSVNNLTMYLILGLSVVILVTIFVLLNFAKRKKLQSKGN